MIKSHKSYRYNYRLIIEYDGAAFHGWQKQKEQSTVQQELENALKVALHSEEISPLQGAGRTDSGVHAKGQVVNFRSNLEIDLRILKHSVSNILRNKLSIVYADVVPMGFNALHSAEARCYKYYILNRTSPPVLEYGRAWHVIKPLDMNKLREDALILLGEHDFSSFRASGCVSKSSVKKIYESYIDKKDDLVIYTIKGKGFLKQMVRNIVGTLVDLNKGTLQKTSIKEILEARDRKTAGMTAPAHGLFLEYVEYENFSRTTNG